MDAIILSIIKYYRLALITKRSNMWYDSGKVDHLVIQLLSIFLIPTLIVIIRRMTE